MYYTISFLNIDSVTVIKEVFAVRDKPWIFEEYEIEGIPWISIGNFPTKIHRLSNFCDVVGFDDIWIKRDDQSSDKYGGNKIRKFEFVLADALKKRRKWIITYGGLGSNQTLAMTIHAKALGLKTIAVLVDQPITEHVIENLWLMHYFGAHISYAGNTAMAVLKTIWHYLTKRGVYMVPVGASNPLGTLGYVDAMFELKRQVENGEAPMPKYIFIPVGSCGTYAGLLLGKKLLDLDVEIRGIKVTQMKMTSVKTIVKLANKALKLLKEHSREVPSVEISEKDVVLDRGYLGDGYGFPTVEGLRAMLLMEKTEHIELEPVYTAKALAALIDFVKKEPDGPLLFWNTYNSVDFSEILEKLDVQKLPKKIRSVVEREKPMDVEMVKELEQEFH